MQNNTKLLISWIGIGSSAVRQMFLNVKTEQMLSKEEEKKARKMLEGQRSEKG